MPVVSVEECRTIFGELAVDKTDDEVAALRDGLTVIANELYDTIQSHARNVPLEHIRWTAYAHDNPNDEDIA